MRNIGLILAIAFCTCAVAAPGLLSRKKRVSGYDNAGIEKDKSNEYESDYEYDDGEFFTCSSGDGERVELFLMCDGYRDCDDGSDEVPSKCEENGVTLLDTLPTTIPTTPEVTTAPTSEPVKPEIIEIGDYDDYVDACTEEEFQCSSDISICLPKFQVCDGVSDCPENEDEEKCHGLTKWIFGAWNPRYEKRVEESDHLRKTKESDYSDYSPMEGNEYHLPDNDLSNPTEETASKVTVVSQPKIVFKEALRPHAARAPVFLPRLEQEVDQNLGLEADYQYITLDKNGNIQDGPLGAELSFQNSKPNRTTGSLPPLRPQHEMEINGETGEVTGIDNEQRRIMPPAISDQEWVFQPQTVKRSKLSIGTPQTGENDRESANTGETRLTKRRKEIRGIIGQLFHRIGSLIEEEDSQGNDFEGVSVQVGLDDDVTETSLHSRILRRPRTHVTLNFNIRL